MQDLIGRSTGRYEIKSEIGSGGMAVVYLAHDATLDVDVAIKFIRTDKLTEENKKQALGRFKREAQKTAHLLHPNIVTVTDFGEFESIPFLVMRYIPGGRTLKRHDRISHALCKNCGFDHASYWSAANCP